LLTALLLLIAEPEANENSSVSRKTQTRCHNEMNLFNNARRVSEYLLPHQLRAVESIFRLLGAVVVTAPATSSMKLKLGL
jgi:hypothetical protein